MNNTAKINIKVGEIEISIEGPSEFVSNQYDKIENHLSTYKELSETIEKSVPRKTKKPLVEVEEEPNNSSGTDTIINLGGLPETFGEWLNAIAKGTSETDKALLAGYFTQLKSDQGYFRSRDVSKLLKEHGIKLSNPSRFVKLNAQNKRSFQHSKNGSEINYKLSRDGEAYAKALLEKAEE
ncbi:MAG: hypothetical protein NXH86_02735 [Flavobacteriaceae bacterium]|nr:hypothetical protein [Flavobacteriaceae bacterium]